MANEDKSARYHRLRRRAAVVGMLAGGLLLLTLLTSGGAVSLRKLTDDATGGTFALSATLYAFLIVLALELVSLPVGYYQAMRLEKRYGLGTMTLATWLLDRLKALAVSGVLAAGAALVVLSLLRLSPQYWWLLASVAFGALLVVLARLTPVVLMPIFYRFRPLDRPSLTERLLTLARRADAEVIGVFEWQLSDRTRKANAALAGIGRSRRILLSDTLLAYHSDDEIEVILAHELAHHVYRDIWSGLALEAGLLALGFFATDRVLASLGGWFGFAAKGDIAVIPLLLLTAGTVSLVLMPAAHALSRAHERRADQYALELTGNPAAFISAMKRLSAQNLAEERPSPLVEWLFHSHPSTSARIAAAASWKPRR